MSDALYHECGIALVRLLKPLEFYREKYGTALYGINKLSLLMEKQHNRGQDGAGVACIKLDMQPGEKYKKRHCAYFRAYQRTFPCYPTKSTGQTAGHCMAEEER
jgi:hypothetical protein